MSRVTEYLLRDVEQRLPEGRNDPVPASVLAADLGVDTRTVRALVSELRSRGHLVGSICASGRTGYFLCTDLEDVRVGTEHLRHRALSMLGQYRALQRSAGERMGPEALRLFDLDREEAMA